MEGSRVKNTKRNIISGLIKQIIGIILPFISRTIILYMLGAQYQGLNGVFTSLLQVLNLADLGFSSAVIYVLYKPISEKDSKKICSIMLYLKKAYRRVGLTILVIGIMIVPILPQIISGTYPKDINIYVLYAIYLFNTVISYMLFSYKSALINAMQRADLMNNIESLTSLSIRIIQIASLLLVKSYYAYVIIIPLGTIVNNILIHITTKKYFPDYKFQGILDCETRKEISKQVKAIMVDKISDVARNSFDNIVISSLFGLTAVAIYSNYYYIFTALYGITAVIRKAMQASIGNSIFSESIEKNYKDLTKFNFMFMWLIGWFTICLLCLYQPFMLLWMRGDNNLLLSVFNMTLFCLYFYLINMNQTRNLYLEGFGLYSKCKIWFIIEAISNLVLNLVLGYILGITGILIATIITIFVFNFIARTNVVFKCYFKKSSNRFYMQHLCYFCVTLFVSMIMYFICNRLLWTGIINLLCRGILCCVIPNLIFFFIYRRTEDFKKSATFVTAIIKR